jgi:hypothetical protein
MKNSKNYNKMGAKLTDEINGEIVKDAIKDTSRNSTTGPGSAPATGGTRNHKGTPAASTGITGDGGE